MKQDKSQLSGTTLKIYAYLVSRGEPVGPREITRALGLSSPSLAYYHLRKLEELGLVEKRSEGYVAISSVRIEGFISLGRRLIPRLLFYSMFYLGLLIVEVIVTVINIISGQPVNVILLTLLIVTGLSFILFLIEGVIAYRKLRP